MKIRTRSNVSNFIIELFQQFKTKSCFSRHEMCAILNIFDMIILWWIFFFCCCINCTIVSVDKIWSGELSYWNVLYMLMYCLGAKFHHYLKGNYLTIFANSRKNCHTEIKYSITIKLQKYLFPTQWVAEGIMFLTCQSVSPVFLVSVTPLKLLNRISWNFEVMKDIMCRCAYPQEILIHFFFLGVRPFLNLETWPNWKILLKQFVKATPLKLRNRTSWNFVVMKDIMYRCAYPQEFDEVFSYF